MGDFFALCGLPGSTGTMQGRARLWGQVLTLIRDYIFIGGGLMAFHMAYSMYGILIHVPYYDHLHNTYLEVWLEQGLLGALAMLWAALVIMPGRLYYPWTPPSNVRSRRLSRCG